MKSQEVNFVALDLETTGLDANNDKIIEVAIVRFNCLGKILAKYSTLVYFSGEFSEMISKLTGIRGSDLLMAPAWEKVRREMEAFIEKEDILIGHNINFDLSFLANAGLDWFGRKKIDSWYLATVMISNASSYSLEYLMRIIGKEYDAHRALDDALALVDLLTYWCGELEKVSDKVLKKIVEFTEKIDIEEGVLYRRELERRRVEKIVMTSNQSRLEQRVGLSKKLGSKQPGVYYIKSDWLDLLKSDKSWGTMVVSLGLWRTYLSRKEWWQEGYVKFDRRERYLCRDFWKNFWPAEVNSKLKARVIIKILLKIDQGFWDGYLDEIVWFQEERKVIDQWSCSHERGDQDCYYDRKLEYLRKTKMPLIVPYSALSMMAKIGQGQELTIFIEDPLLEDGLSKLTAEGVDRDYWQGEEKKLLEYSKEGKVDKRDREKITEMLKDLELFRRSLLLINRSQGQKQAGKISLDFTPAVCESYAFKDLAERWSKIGQDWQEISGGKNLWQKINLLFQNKEWLATLVEYDNGYFRLDWQRRRFDDWLQKLQQDYSTINLVHPFSAGKNNYFWRLLLPGRIEVAEQQAALEELDILESSWVNMSQMIRESGDKTTLLVFNSLNDLQTAKELLAKNDPGMLYYELGGKRGTQYYDLYHGKYQGVVLSTFYNLTTLGSQLVKFDLIYLDRLPFDPPDKFEIATRAMEWQDGYFQGYMLPRMCQKLYYVWSLMKSGGKFYLGDVRWWKKKYVEQVKRYL